MRAAAAADARWGRESSQGERGQEEEEEEPLSVARNVQGEKRGVTKERKGGRGCPILARGSRGCLAIVRSILEAVQENYLSKDNYTLVFKYLF